MLVGVNITTALVLLLAGLPPLGLCLATREHDVGNKVADGGFRSGGELRERRVGEK
jgi:hypothetical protein